MSTLSATVTTENVEELSVQQLEQLLAKKRLSIAKTELGKGTSKIDTIVAHPTDAVGPVVYLELVIEGYPVKAVVDCGAQSTTLSHGLLHQVARRTCYSNSSATKCKTLQLDETKGRSVLSKCELPAEIPAVESQVCIIRSTYLPNCRTTVLEARLQSPFAAGETLLFEPMQGKAKVADLEMPEALLTQQPNGCVLIPVENHGSLSSRLEPGDCVGTVAPIDSTLLQQDCISDNSVIAARRY